MTGTKNINEKELKNLSIQNTNDRIQNTENRILKASKGKCTWLKEEHKSANHNKVKCELQTNKKVR